MIDLSPVVLTVTPLVTSEAQTYASVERITEVAINPIPTPFLVVHSPLKYLTILIASSDSSVLGVCPFVVVMRLPAPFEFLHLLGTGAPILLLKVAVRHLAILVCTSGAEDPLLPATKKGLGLVAVAPGPERTPALSRGGRRLTTHPARRRLLPQPHSAWRRFLPLTSFIVRLPWLCLFREAGRVGWTRRNKRQVV